MRLAVRRPAQVLAIVEELRDHHPALRGRFTWRVAQRVFAEAGILVRLHRMRARARVISLGEATVITINPDQPPRWHAGLAAHEWGHVLLHSEAGAVRQVASCYRGDPRELEAKLFARLLVGAHVDLEHPEVAPLAARLERAAAQFVLPIDVAPAVPPAPPELPPLMPSRLQHVLRTIDRRKVPYFRRVLPPPDPFGELRYDLTRRGIYWTDREERTWRIHTRGDRRVFVSPSGRRFVYRLRRGERQDLRPSHLELQLRSAAERPRREEQCLA